MHATIGRYEGVDAKRTEELTRKVDESLVPELRKLAGFSGYYFIETDDGVLSSVGLFEHPTQADEATKLTASWVKRQGLESALPNEPRITAGKVVAHGNGVAVA
jgi:hypothetical protein